MNKYFISKLSLVFLVFQTLFVSAQQPSNINLGNKRGSTIIEELNSKRPAQGNVMIHQDEAIKGIISKSSSANLPIFTAEDGMSQYVKMRGYKIQVFSGNDQRKSKDEAYSKEKLVNESFEDVETVVYFNSPRWILRAGNFKTRSEANEVLEQFMKQFPTFGKEMYVVSDTVKIPF